MASGTIKAIVDKTKALNNGHIVSLPASVDELMSYLPGFYRFGFSEQQTIFPTSYGLLEILIADTYGLARVTRVNSSVAQIWQRSWNTSTKAWYESDWVSVT